MNFLHLQYLHENQQIETINFSIWCNDFPYLYIIMRNKNDVYIEVKSTVTVHDKSL